MNPLYLYLTFAHPYSRRYMAEILPIRRKTPYSQSINQSIRAIYFPNILCFIYLLRRLKYEQPYNVIRLIVWYFTAYRQHFSYIMAAISLWKWWVLTFSLVYLAASYEPTRFQILEKRSFMYQGSCHPWQLVESVNISPVVQIGINDNICIQYGQ